MPFPSIPLVNHEMSWSPHVGNAAGGETEGEEAARALLAGKGAGRRVGCSALMMFCFVLFFPNRIERAGGKLGYSFG